MRKTKSARGFTLVELMIGVLILGVGSALIVNTYMLALRGVNSAQNNIEAAILAREKFDELELSSLGVSGGLSSFVDEGSVKSQGKKYNYTLNVTAIAHPEDLNELLVQACITLSWQEQNKIKNVTLSSYLPKKAEPA